MKTFKTDEATRARKRAWAERERAKDPERFKQKQREAVKRSYEKNAAAVIARKRKWRAENVEAERAHRRKQYINNREACIAASKQWKLDNPDRVRDYRRRYQLNRNYGLTLEERDAMLAAQGGVCAVCGSDDPRSRLGWMVDHCHNSTMVRGIVCHPCNSGLGGARDSIETLKRMIAYLEASQASINAEEQRRSLVNTERSGG